MRNWICQLTCSPIRMTARVLAATPSAVPGPACVRKAQSQGTNQGRQAGIGKEAETLIIDRWASSWHSRVRASAARRVVCKPAKQQAVKKSQREHGLQKQPVDSTTT